MRRQSLVTRHSSPCIQHMLPRGSDLSRSFLSDLRRRLQQSKQRARSAIARAWDAYEDVIGVRQMREMQQTVLTVRV